MKKFLITFFTYSLRRQQSSLSIHFILVANFNTMSYNTKYKKWKLMIKLTYYKSLQLPCQKQHRGLWRTGELAVFIHGNISKFFKRTWEQSGSRGAIGIFLREQSKRNSVNKGDFGNFISGIASAIPLLN